MREIKFIFIILFGVTVLLGIYAAITITEEELKGVLVTLAQLNVAIAVGVGALSIGYAQDRKVQRKLTESAIVIVLMSLITFLMANVDWLLMMKKFYLAVNIIIICMAMTLTLVVTQKDKE